MSNARSLIVREMIEHITTIRQQTDISSTTMQRITGLDITTPDWCQTSSIVIKQDSKQAYDALPALANVRIRDLLGIIVKRKDQLQAEEGVTFTSETEVNMLQRMETTMRNILYISSRSYQEITNSLFVGICHVNISQRGVDEIVVNKLVDAAFSVLPTKRPAPSPSPSSPPPSDKSKEDQQSGWIIIGIGGVLLFLVIISGVILFLFRR